MKKGQYKRTLKHIEIAKRNLKKFNDMKIAPWNKGVKGLHLSPETEFKSGRKDEKMYNWKGDTASYHGIHAWVSRWKGKPKICEKCGRGGLTGNKIHWANIDHKYRRVLDQYIRLCAKCHYAFDSENLKSKRNKKNGKKS